MIIPKIEALGQQDNHVFGLLIFRSHLLVLPYK